MLAWNKQMFFSSKEFTSSTYLLTRYCIQIFCRSLPHFSVYLVAILWIPFLSNHDLDASPPIIKLILLNPVGNGVHPEFWDGLLSKACIHTILFDDAGSWILQVTVFGCQRHFKHGFWDPLGCTL